MQRSKVLHVMYRAYSKVMDKWEDHPFELSVSLALVLFGTKALADGFQTVPGSISVLPLWLVASYCALSAAGGGSVIVGIFLRDRILWAYGLERFGLFVSASAFGSYIIGLLFPPFRPTSTLAIAALIALGVGCLFKARALSRRANATMFALRYANKDEEDGRA